jgi:KTSC domain-containing protein
MDRVPVSSSHITSVGYDPGSRVMHIEFHNGDIYEYKGVAEYHNNQLLNAASAGKHFHRNFKPNYEGVKIN